MAHGESPVHTSDLGATGERIDALLTASATGGVVARERAEELVRLVTDLYGVRTRTGDGDPARGRPAG